MHELLSYNIQYGKNLNQINRWIGELPKRPDIICYQEYPEDQLSESDSLRTLGYSYEFARGLVKHERAYGELTAYKEDKYKLKVSKVIDLGVSELEKRVFGHSGQRSALVTSLEVNGQEFIIANLHLLWLAVHERRKKQIGMVIKEIEDDKPALIIGDFNYSSLVAGKGLSKFLSKEGFTPAGGKIATHKFFGIQHQLDYIFQRNCSVAEVSVGDVKLSDHSPVFVSFDIP